MPTLIIDGKTANVPDGATLLDVAKRCGIEIPTLCHHPALEPYGGCRLCLVQITRPEWNGTWKIVVSCMAPAEPGLIVQTSTEAVHAARKDVVDLLLARCPQTPLVQELAGRYGLEKSSFEGAEKPTDCVLCGLCSRACDRLGVSAISMVERGSARVVAPPLGQPPEDCVGCLACAEICPTHCIPFTRNGQSCVIWGRRFEMIVCRACGAPTITRELAALLEQRGACREDLEYCDSCKRRRISDVMAAIAHLEPVVADG